MAPGCPMRTTKATCTVKGEKYLWNDGSRTCGQSGSATSYINNCCSSTAKNKVDFVRTFRGVVTQKVRNIPWIFMEFHGYPQMSMD